MSKNEEEEEKERKKSRSFVRSFGSVPRERKKKQIIVDSYSFFGGV
jgi:hypothetical protein